MANLTQLTTKVDALIAEGETVVSTEYQHDIGYLMVDAPKMAQWSVNALALVRSMFGTESEHYVRMRPHITEHRSGAAKDVLAVLKAAKAALNQGYVFELRDLVRADVEADLFDQATTLLEGGYDRAAAVVVGAVVEERLRAVAPSWNVPVVIGGKPLTMEPLNIELKKAGAYDGIMQKRIALLGGLRNKAAHGEPFQNRTSDVESMIRDAVSICATVIPK
jgi:hypothetical protein